jgi:thioredoxin reductase
MKPDGDGFIVRTGQASYRTATVLLAIGRRGTPRKLGVPGEEPPKVVYRLIEAAQYREKHIIVVGGGGSALEAALDVCDETGTTVTLSYRGAAFNRAKIKNRYRPEGAIAGKRLELMLETPVTNISADRIRLQKDKDESEFSNDAVIVCAGGELSTLFLKKIGVLVEARYGTQQIRAEAQRIASAGPKSSDPRNQWTTVRNLLVACDTAGAVATRNGVASV